MTTIDLTPEQTAGLSIAERAQKLVAELLKAGTKVISFHMNGADLIDYLNERRTPLLADVDPSLARRATVPAIVSVFGTFLITSDPSLAQNRVVAVNADGFLVGSFTMNVRPKRETVEAE